MTRAAEPDVDQRILNAADELFQRFGFKKTTVGEIANEAGVAKGSMYLHFPSKEKLLMALMKRMVRSFMKKADKDLEKIESSKERIAMLLRIRTKKVHSMYNSHAFPEDLLPAFLKSGIEKGAMEEPLRLFEEKLTEILKRGRARAEFCKTLDCTCVAHHLNFMSMALLPPYRVERNLAKILNHLDEWSTSYLKCFETPGEKK